MRTTIVECFWVSSANVKHVLLSVLKRTVLPAVYLNVDLWTSKVSHQKFLFVRVMWKSDPSSQQHCSQLLVLYVPPKVQDKKASDWLLEYVLTVLKWYGIEPSHVKGTTSDTGSDFLWIFMEPVV